MTRTAAVTEMWGQCETIAEDPSISIHNDTFYLPFRDNGTWGLFTSHGAPIEDAIDYRGAERATNSQVLETHLTGAEIPNTAPLQLYVYGGRIHVHFGHFLINTLSRFWDISRSRHYGLKILCHGPADPEEWFRYPFLRDIFQRVGLTSNDFVTFDRPTRIGRIIVPRTSFREQHSAHHAYRRLCRGIGRGLYDAAAVNTIKAPIYYSKTRLPSGVGTIVNEDEIISVMERNGVDVAFPEQMTFAEQVRSMAERRTILGTAGSFLHTSIFCPPRRIVALNPTGHVISNFNLIDALNGNRAAYLHVPEIEVLDPAPDHTFLTTRRLPDAARVAEEMIEVASRA